MNTFLTKLILLLMLLPSTALAHHATGEGTSFMHGLLHPIFGLDHVLAMVAVGIWAAQIGGQARWGIPSTFVVVMLLGGLFGVLDLSVPFIEVGILASILVLGLLIASTIKLPFVYSALIVGFFALFHGYAHGAEMPTTTTLLAYSAGFMVATTALHAIGVALGFLFQRYFALFTRVIGAAIALSGLYLAIA